MGVLAAALLSLLPQQPLQLQLESTQQERFSGGPVLRSFTGALRLELSLFTAGVSLFGSAGDPFSQDPLREEDFVAPDLSLRLRDWTLRAQYARALRADSDHTFTLVASCSF